MLKIDLHMHSLHSGHACGSVYEVMDEAARKKMKVIAITEHGPRMPGSAPDNYFRACRRAPRKYKGMKVLWGCEANLVDEEGNIDLSDKSLKRVDILLLGIHSEAVGCGDFGKEGNTRAIIKCFKKHRPHIFTHPDARYYDYDLERVCQAAVDNGVLLEINLSAFGKIKGNSDKRRLEGLKKIVEIAKKNKAKVIVNSDAHFLHEIGDDSMLKKYKKILGLTDDMIINNYPKEVMTVLQRKR